MCGGGGGGSNGATELAEQQRRDQEAREARIRRGMQQIEALFEGGRVGANPDGTSAGYRPGPNGSINTRLVNTNTGFDPNRTYYDSAGELVYDPSMAASLDQAIIPQPQTTATTGRPYGRGNTNNTNNSNNISRPSPRAGGGNMSTDTEASQTAAASAELSNAIKAAVAKLGISTESGQTARELFNQAFTDNLLFTGTKEVEGFTDDFFTERSNAYADFANPQAAEQYDDAQEALTFALSRAGTLDSSVAADRFGDTEEDYRSVLRQIADTGAEYEQEARNAVADERGRMTQMLQVTGDPNATLAGVGNVLRSLRLQPAFDPIGPIFQNATAGIGNYLEGRRYADLNRRLDEMFRSPSEGSGRTVR